MDLSNVNLHSERLRLTSFAPTDAGEIFACVTPSLTQFMAFEPSHSLQEFKKIWEKWVPKMTCGTDVFLVIRLMQTNEFLGLLGIHDIRLDTREVSRSTDAEPEIGIWIKEKQHGHGYGREAISAAISWATHALGVKALIYPVAVANTASQRIPEYLHAKLVGKRTLIKQHGKEYSMLVYRISASTPTAPQSIDKTSLHPSSNSRSSFNSENHDAPYPRN